MWGIFQHFFSVDFIGKLLTGILSGLFQDGVSNIESIFGMAASASGIPDLTRLPWVIELIRATQGIAGAILALRVTHDAILLASVRAEGAPADPGLLIKRAVWAAAGIAAAPFLASQFFRLNNLLVNLIGNLDFGGGHNLSAGLGHIAIMAATSLFWSIVLAVPSLVLIILLLIMIFVRAGEMVIAAVVGPLMAIGFMSDGGTAEVWFKEFIVLSTSQAVQLLMMYAALAFLAVPDSFGSAIAGPFLFLGMLWVAYKSPHILRTYAYATGGGKVAGSAITSMATKALTALFFA